MDYKEDLKNKLPELKKLDGFPNGSDEDILALSDPPYYTACPNPYIADFIKEHGKPYDEATDDYHREPYLGDLSFGRGDDMLNAHFYHTKVPPQAIQLCIEHYTKPGDIIFDGFCGTGTTGIASNRLDRSAILMDLSPIATFISSNLNRKIDFVKIAQVVKDIENDVKEKINSLYKVVVSGKEKIINYTIW
jgi:DNA modification methylase